MRRLLAAIVLAACLMPGAGVAGFDDGVEAYLRGHYTTALREFRPLAEQGNAVAQTFLGIMYDYGLGVQRDDVEAVRWYRLAAEQGNADAQFNLGNMYVRGRGVPRDYAEAVRWYRLAAEQGDARAQYNLGVGYARGRGVPRDYTEAYKWFSLGAAAGFEIARTSLDTVEQKMTPSQVAEAQRRARGWKPGTSSAVARWWENGPLAPDGPAPALVAEAQRFLAGLGFDPGPVDGVVGPRTRQAVTAYQRREKLSVDGTIDDALVARMRADVAAVARKPNLAGTGTGFYVGTAGHILTNAHVVDGCREIRIPPSQHVLALAAAHRGQAEGEGVSDWWEADPIVVFEQAREVDSDLALLFGAGAVAKSAPFRQGAGIRSGEQVVVAGYPLRGLLASDINITVGNVSALAGIGDDDGLFQITAPVQPGNSGGPVLDMSGSVVGVVVGKLDAARVAAITGDIPQNINFAISAEAVRSFLAAEGVAYAAAPSNRDLKPADIAASARTFTVVVECWR